MALTKAQGKFSQAIDDGANATAITIDSSERVGIGTSTATYDLTVVGASNLSTIGTNDAALRFRADGARTIQFYTNSEERMRINSSGNVFVGKSTADSAINGVQLVPNGITAVGRSGGEALRLNRNTSNGNILRFQYAGTSVGNIGSEGGDSLYMQSGDAGLRFSDGANAVFPCKEDGVIRDNAVDLGLSSARFNTVYAGTSTINTSDKREKQDIEELTEAETRVAVAAKALLRKYRWKDMVQAKDNNSDSDETARIHFGIIAQDLQAAFEAEGLDAGRYGMFIHTTWTDEETGEERDRMGIRYSELLAFIIAAI